MKHLSMGQPRTGKTEELYTAHMPPIKRGNHSLISDQLFELLGPKELLLPNDTPVAFAQDVSGRFGLALTSQHSLLVANHTGVT